MVMLLVALIVLLVVLSLLYMAVVQIPLFAPYQWAVRAIFLVLAALVIYQLFFGGGLHFTAPLR